MEYEVVMTRVEEDERWRGVGEPVVEQMSEEDNKWANEKSGEQARARAGQVRTVRRRMGRVRECECECECE